MHKLKAICAAMSLEMGFEYWNTTESVGLVQSARDP